MSYHLKWWYLNVIPSQMMVFSWEKDLWKCRIFRSKSIITDPSNYSLALALSFSPSFSQIFIQWNSSVPGWSFIQPDLHSVELFGSWPIWLMFSFLTIWDFRSPLIDVFNLSFRSNIVKSQYSNIPPLKTLRLGSGNLWTWQTTKISTFNQILCSFEPYLRDGITTWLYARWLRAFTRAFCMCLRASPGLSFSILCRTWCRGSKKTLF